MCGGLWISLQLICIGADIDISIATVDQRWQFHRGPDCSTTCCNNRSSAPVIKQSVYLCISEYSELSEDDNLVGVVWVVPGGHGAGDWGAPSWSRRYHHCGQHWPWCPAPVPLTSDSPVPGIMTNSGPCTTTAFMTWPYSRPQYCQGGDYFLHPPAPANPGININTRTMRTVTLAQLKVTC